MMASAALKPKRAASPPPRPKSAHNSPVRKALFVPKGASEMKKRELAGSYEDFTPEPLLMENPNRFVLFPIEHADVWAMYKTVWKSTSAPLSWCRVDGVEDDAMIQHEGAVKF